MRTVSAASVRLCVLSLGVALALPAHAEQVLVLQDGRRIAVTRLVRRDGNVMFETTKGERFSVPEAEVVSPPLDTIPVLGAAGEPAAPAEATQVLELKDGRRIAVVRLARRNGQVVFETTKGERFSVPETEVAAPPLETIPGPGGAPQAAEQVLELTDGRRIAVRKLARRDGQVLLETTKGERFSVPESEVVSPPLGSIPLGTPPPPAAAPVAPAPEPAPAPPVVTPPAAPPAVLPPAPPAPRWSGQYPLPDLKPLGYAGGTTVHSDTPRTDDMIPMPDRWRLGFPRYDRYRPKQGMPWIEGSVFDPYNQNLLKADYPIAGNELFANLNLQSASTFNQRRRVENVARSETFLNQNLVAGFELFRGSTVFRPKDWSLKATGVFNVRRVSPDGADAVTNDKIALEEGFAEVRLKAWSPHFDFVSVRGGMQNLTTDFRGFVFSDNQLGVRLFGNAGANRHQYNLAWFSMRQRDLGTALHTFDGRDQDVLVANWFVQDALTPGYTLLFNVHHDRDSGAVAPGLTAVPQADPGTLSATWIGIHGDGRWGGWNVSHAFYQVFGSDDFNPVAGGPVDVNAQMAAIELSRDFDWKRWRIGAFYASGDDDPTDGDAKGFDAIVDNPNFAGGDFMFWSSQNTRLLGGGLVNTQSLLPNMRNKFNERSNFVNPGLVFVNAGLDMRLSPRLKVVTNVSWLRFARDVAPFAVVGPKPDAGTGIGIDVGAGAEWRPALNENLKVVVGAAGLFPSGVFKQLAGDQTLFTAFAALQLAY